ncbi:MAG: hypothetical protein OSB21_09585 [Myxococcota bacterium]|nr:hypothetical protein [Myxococcota bacterium]
MKNIFALSSLALLLACPNGGQSDPDAGSSSPDAGNPEAPLVWHEVVNAYAPGAVLSVWSSAPDNVWMVGGEADSGFALHFDGQRWTKHDPGTGAQLWWVHGWDDGTLMVAGERGGIARFDGSTWSLMPTDAPGVVFFGIWGATSDDVWAVGGAQPDSPDGVQPVADALYHFDGQSWQRIEHQFRPVDRQGEGDNLYKVWGLDSESVFIVGSGGLAAHKQADEWGLRSTPNSQAVIFTLSGRNYDDVYAVGGIGTALMVHWDGRVWKDQPLPADSPTSLPGVWTAAGQPVYVAGARGFTGRLDGERWTTAWLDTAQSFHAIHFDGQRLWAVGGDIDARRADHIGAIFCSNPVASP